MNIQKDVKINLFKQTIQKFIDLDWKNIELKDQQHHSELYLKFESKLFAIIQSYVTNDFFPAKDFILVIAQYQSQLYHLPLNGIIHFHHPFMLCRNLEKEINKIEFKLEKINYPNSKCLCELSSKKNLNPDASLLILTKQNRDDFYDQYDEYYCKQCQTIWHYTDKSTEQYTQWVWTCKTKFK
jgi:hypothetical protein